MQKAISKLIRRFRESTLSYSKSELNCFGIENQQLFPTSEEVVAKTLHLNSNMETFSDLIGWFRTVCPAFPVNANNVKILKDPSEFYQTLLLHCSSAQYRITFASLYLGTGDLEKTLVETIKRRMHDLQGQLKVTFLFDHSRGSRGEINSRTMVAPLLREQPNACQVSLYHTVALRGLLRSLIPERYNELIGLQHMKLYVIDDTVIMSGANLSNDYFTNRQDRYIVLTSCRELADFYSNLVSHVCQFSFQLLPCGSTSLHSSWSPLWHPYKGHKQKFIEEANTRIQNSFFLPMTQLNNNTQESDTWVFPLIQMNQLKVRHDSEVTAQFLENSPQGSMIHLTTGYFNLTKDLVENILHKSPSKFSLLSAHPSANGFLNARGLAGGIPAAYTQLSKEFFKHVISYHLPNRIEMREFFRPGWTYHGKGLWLTLPGHSFPSLTFIGSPNFGSRSYERDLETQIAIVTTNENLQKRLAEERDRLYERSTVVEANTFSEADRLVPAWVLCISWLFRNFF